jgi:hypothetical protein
MVESLGISVYEITLLFLKVLWLKDEGEEK